MEMDAVHPNEPHFGKKLWNSGVCGKHLCAVVRAKHVKRKKDSAGDVGVNRKPPRVRSTCKEDRLVDSKFKKGKSGKTLWNLGVHGKHLLAAVRAKYAKRKRDGAGEVGRNGKRPRVTSIGKEHRLVDTKFKDRKSDVYLTTGGKPSSDDESSDVYKMKIIHDEVENFLRSTFGYGNYNDFMDKYHNLKGAWGNHLRAVVHAKTAKWKRRGESGYAKPCLSSTLANEGLTDGDVSKLRLYFFRHMGEVPNIKEWSSEGNMKGAYGAYVRALLRTRGIGFFDNILMEMIKEGIPLKTLAIVMTETSYSDVMQFCLEVKQRKQQRST